jgi:hypothetical protein
VINPSLLAAWKELSEQIVRFEQRAIEHPGLSPYHPETRQLAEAIPGMLAEVGRLQLGMGALDVELNRQRIMAKGHLAEIARLKSLCREACDLADTAARFLSPLYRSKFYRRDGARIAAIRQEVAGE